MVEPNIVQAEFFHTGGAESLAALLSDCVERARDGVPIKTVVRYYDHGGYVTLYALTLDHIRVRHDLVMSKYSRSKGVIGIVRRSLLWWSARKLQKFEGRVRKMASLALGAAIEQSSPVAIETASHRFRIARANELHELQEAARRSTGVWLFVFSYNDLLSDTNKMVVSVM